MQLTTLNQTRDAGVALRAQIRDAGVALKEDEDFGAFILVYPALEIIEGQKDIAPEIAKKAAAVARELRVQDQWTHELLQKLKERADSKARETGMGQF
jgi:hypothetical protein